MWLSSHGCGAGGCATVARCAPHVVHVSAVACYHSASFRGAWYRFHGARQPRPNETAQEPSQCHHAALPSSFASHLTPFPGRGYDVDGLDVRPVPPDRFGLGKPQKCTQGSVRSGSSACRQLRKHLLGVAGTRRRDKDGLQGRSCGSPPSGGLLRHEQRRHDDFFASASMLESSMLRSIPSIANAASKLIGAISLGRPRAHARASHRRQRRQPRRRRCLPLGDAVSAAAPRENGSFSFVPGHTATVDYRRAL